MQDKGRPQRLPSVIPQKQTSHLFFNATFSLLNSKKVKLGKLIRAMPETVAFYRKMTLFLHFLTVGFENTYHRSTLKVVMLVSLLMSVQSFRPVFLPCF